MDASEAIPITVIKNESANNNDMESNDALETSRPGEKENLVCSKATQELLARYARCCFQFFRSFLLLLALDGAFAVVLSCFTKRSMPLLCKPGYHECVALLSLAHAAFFHGSARAIEQETARLDDKAATRSEQPPSDEECAKAPLLRSKNGGEEDYHLLYGRVARSIDNFLAKYCDNDPCDTPTSGSRNNKSSMLSHLCWILFALCVAFGTAFVPAPIFRGDTCKDIPPLAQRKPSPSTAAPIKNISGYPKELREWITGDERHRTGTWDYVFPFPNTNERTYQYTNAKTRRGVLSTENEMGYPVLVEHVSVNQTFVTHLHPEVVRPTLFVPVQSTLIMESTKRDLQKERADQYCLAKEGDIFTKKGQNRYQRTSTVYCLDTRGLQNNQPAILTNTTLAWFAKGIPSGLSVIDMAASYQDMVFFGRICPNYDDGHGYREVYRVDPNTMETELVYSNAPTVDSEYDGLEFRQRYRARRRSSEKIQLITGLCGLVCAVFHLIVQRGVESGAVFVGWALVLPILGYLDLDYVGMVCFLVTVLCQCLIHCGDASWIHPFFCFRKNTCVWALYGVLVPFAYLALTDDRLDHDTPNEFTAGLVWLALNGAILGHPMLEAIGCSFVALGGFSLLGCALGDDDFKYANTYGGWLMCGLGCIMVGNWCRANRHWYYPRGKYHLRTFFAWLKQEFIHQPTPVVHPRDTRESERVAARQRNFRHSGD